MPSWFEGMPFGIAVAALFVIVLLRAQGTYWIGRGVTAGALRTRFADKLTGPRTTKAITLLNRYGPCCSRYSGSRLTSKPLLGELR